MIKIYCKNENRGKLAYYVSVDNRDYFLFEQSYRKSNKECFRNGIFLDDLKRYRTQGRSMQNVIEKILPYLKYIEKEFDLTLFRRTERKKSKSKGKSIYRRSYFRTNLLESESA